MSRKATGTIEWVPADPKKGETRGHYRARISLKDGARPWIDFDPGPRSDVAEKSARHRAEGIAEDARRRGLTAKDFGITTKAMRAEIAAAPDMSKWIETWLESRRARGHTSVRENESHWEHHIKAIVGGRHIRDWTQDDMRALSRDLDRKVQANEVRWKTSLNIWATASKMCRDSCTSKIDALRVRDDNPARDVAPPDRGAEISKQFLYPSEFARFVWCADVPAKWRLVVALAVFLYPRADELRELSWQDVDLDHGVIHIHRTKHRETGDAKSTKTKHPRRFSIEPRLIPLLKMMHDACGGEGKVCDMPSERDMARGLRRWLWKANVRRSELHYDTPTTKKITFHDLRATGVTWEAVRGTDPLKIQQRAGHEDFATTQGYIRTAEAVRAGFGQVFPSLPEFKKERLRTGPDPESSGESSGAENRALTIENYCGADGTRTRGLRRDRPAL